ncbi:MAG: FMN-binding protein [Clostridiaceae bacterium]|nr:FMN-binding protein [Clostridiaceae bacterium]
MKQKTRKKSKITIAVIAILVLAIAIALGINLPKPLETFDTSFDLSQIADGTYSGYCDNGLVKVEAEVSVENHTITDVRLVKHQNGLGSSAEAIVDTVVEHQSVEIDAIAGATMSSKTILKAIENALSERKEN